ncbi:hypothetical protein BX285_2948 [Streptomyces sp. 1114.5]|uniref:hypothetical protein n=1 Tax=Streptomyces sp. 1114.5 TaxID=1938830 RepID=UPI000EB2DA84|nr:hypothetical protein [Streptomyces sp. 1114.5]RKT18521.1 hypothetical protein BX285_2948 [Streptomyces sp. 1114.5]
MMLRHRLTVVTTAAALAAAGLAAGTAHAAARTSAMTANSPTLTASCSQAYLPLPDPDCTPGAYNPDVTQDTIGQTICVSGWTATVRPSTSYTNKLKVQQIAQYGYADTSTADYEEDHLVPLELGGAPRDPANLWPEPRYGSQPAQSKDSVETKLKNAVCGGRVSLDDARSAIASDWTTALSVLGL